MPEYLLSQSQLGDHLNIWLVDDDVDFSQLICQSFHDLGCSCLHLKSSTEFHNELSKAKPDLLLLDEILNNERGTDLLWQERQTNSIDFPVLIISALGSPHDRVAGFNAGADDYLIKPFLFQELLIRVERLLKNEPARHRLNRQQSHTYQKNRYNLNGALLDLDQQALIATNGEKHSLSRGECLILEMLCANAGDVVAREALLEASKSSANFQTTRTVDVKISRLRKVLALTTSGDPILIESIRGKGYRINADITT